MMAYIASSLAHHLLCSESHRAFSKPEQNSVQKGRFASTIRSCNT